MFIYTSLAVSEALIAQVPVASEVRQIVTFTFLPGKTGDAVEAFQDKAMEFYAQDENMLSFRAFHEVESPIPLDLMIIRAFRGMAGMDRSNNRLNELATNAGTTMGAFYAEIGVLISEHHDQFIEMLPSLGSGDPSSRRLTAFIWYRILPAKTDDFEHELRKVVVAGEKTIPSATGRFLVADGWHYLRMLGFDSLGEYQDYWTGMNRLPEHKSILSLTAERREVIAASVSELSVR